MFSQLNLRSVPTEAWALAGTITGFAAWAGKKLLSRRQAANPKPKPEYITRAEFHQGLDSVRDRVAAGYLALADKLDASHRTLADTLDRHATNVEQRLDRLDTAVARLDERTK